MKAFHSNQPVATFFLLILTLWMTTFAVPQILYKNLPSASSTPGYVTPCPQAQLAKHMATKACQQVSALYWAMLPTQSALLNSLNELPFLVLVLAPPSSIFISTIFKPPRFFS